MDTFQRRTVELLLSSEFREKKDNGWDEKKKSYQWSKFLNKARKLSQYRSLNCPNYLEVRDFLNIYCDTLGKKPFSVVSCEKSGSLGDFWVRINDL